MAARKSKHVRLFRSAAIARLEEAEYLRTGSKTVGAVYLAGYAVECMLKALILAALPEHRQPGMIDQFRGSRAHDFDWLQETYWAGGGAAPPRSVVAAFAAVDVWGTELRYNPRVKYSGNADDFFAAVADIVAWVEGRL
jgi:hypothetical protein